MCKESVNRSSKWQEWDDIKSYWDKLSPEEQEWLKANYIQPELFNDCKGLPSEQRKRIHRKNYLRRNDLFSQKGLTKTTLDHLSLVSSSSAEQSVEDRLSAKKIISRFSHTGS